MAGRLKKNVCPLLLGVEPAQLQVTPLSRLQARSSLDKEQVRQLVQDVNESLGDRYVDRDIISKAVDDHWPALNVSRLTATSPLVAERSAESKIDEALQLLQALNTTVSGLTFQAPVPTGASPLLWGDPRLAFGDPRVKYGAAYLPEDPDDGELERLAKDVLDFSSGTRTSGLKSRFAGLADLTTFLGKLQQTHPVRHARLMALVEELRRIGKGTIP